MPFETYTGGIMGKIADRQPKATIVKQGNINFNTAATHLFKQRQAKHIQLLYDRETHRIAFKPCQSTRSYPAAWNVEQGMLIIDLGCPPPWSAQGCRSLRSLLS